MKLTNELFSLLHENVKEFKCKDEAEAFQNILKEQGIDDVDVDIIKDGSDYIVSLQHEEDKEVLVFGVDGEGDAYCMSTSGVEDPLDTENDVVDLQTCEPALKEDGTLDMTNLSWMNKSVVQALFSEALDEDTEDKNVDVEEKVRIAIKGGKKVKIPVKLRKKILNSKQRAALVKARRKSGTAASLRKRAVSLKIRKRMGLK